MLHMVLLQGWRQNEFIGDVLKQLKLWNPGYNVWAGTVGSSDANEDIGTM